MPEPSEDWSSSEKSSPMDYLVMTFVIAGLASAFIKGLLGRKFSIGLTTFGAGLIAWMLFQTLFFTGFIAVAALIASLFFTGDGNKSYRDGGGFGGGFGGGGSFGGGSFGGGGGFGGGGASGGW